MSDQDVVGQGVRPAQERAASPLTDQAEVVLREQVGKHAGVPRGRCVRHRVDRPPLRQPPGGAAVDAPRRTGLGSLQRELGVLAEERVDPEPVTVLEPRDEEAPPLEIVDEVIRVGAIQRSVTQSRSEVAEN